MSKSTLKLRPLLLSTGLVAVMASFGATPANSAAFYIQEQSVSGLGTAFAGTGALGEDASTIFYNPAAMTELKGPQVQLGVHMLKPSADMKDNGSTVTNALGTNTTGPDDGGDPYDVEAIPNFYAAYPISEDNKLWLGFGVSAPFGLANDYGDDWFGRYDSISSELKTIDFSPNLAWGVTDWLSIGGGLNIQYADAELVAAVASPLTVGGPTVATDGQTNLSGHDTTIGFNAGLLLKPMDGTNIGMHYRSGISHDLEGRLIVTNPVDAGGAVTRIGGEAGLDLPDVATLSVAQHVTNKLQVLASLSHIGWENFNSIPVELATGTLTRTELDYDDTYAIAVGLRYKPNENWVLRAGYQFDETPTNDEHRTTSIPDGDRQWFALGAGYQLNDKWGVDLGAVYVDVDEEDINLTEAFSATTSGTTTATTEGDVGIVSLSLKYNF
jgi:long-chain fatty acid transport protein